MQLFASRPGSVGCNGARVPGWLLVGVGMG